MDWRCNLKGKTGFEVWGRNVDGTDYDRMQCRI
jgi:hypothetical protein